MDNHQFADMHIHSVYSDGILTLSQIFQKAKNVGLTAISITDHDTIDGCDEAFSLSKEHNIDYFTGIEFSCFEGLKEYHILGYNVDPDNKELKEHLSDFKVARFERAEKILVKLESLNMPVKMEDVLEIAGKSPIIRPHIAKALLVKKYVRSIKEAFQKYLGDWRPAYVTKKTYLVERAIKLINKSGGIASLAHPGPFIEQDDLYRMIQSGLDGIEVVHPMHDESLQKFYHSVASQYWLLETGGSDFHGNKEYDEENFGKVVVPYYKFDAVRKH